jgi:nifR3 family TIM-barrel protein
MDYGFWKKLPEPIMTLAPMYDVTDAAFRVIIAKYGKPDVFWTEFVSAEGLNHPEGRQRLLHHLKFGENEKPIVAQIFGSHSEAFAPAAELLREMNFDGIDINMGCPDRSMVAQGSCAALIRTPKLAQEIIRETKKGAGDLPVSVKIRIGDSKIEWKDWIGYLLEAEPAAITIHLRTRKEMSKVPAHWELMPEIVKYIHSQTAETNRPIILGNGDIPSLDDGRAKVAATDCDGVMIGRGIFGNPWLFNPEYGPVGSGKKQPTQEQRLAVLLEHAELFEKYYSGFRSFEIMKKHFKAYIHSFDGAAELRAELMQARNFAGVKNILEPIILNPILKGRSLA